MRRIVMTAVAALIFAAGAGELRAQRNVVLSQLDASFDVWTNGGYRPDLAVFGTRQLVGLLQEDGSVILEVSLDKGISYGISGVCDIDCSDLDLVLLSGDGASTLDSDLEADDTPVLQFVTTEAGPHLLNISMYECSDTYCFFGVRIYRK